MKNSKNNSKANINTAVIEVALLKCLLVLNTESNRCFDFN